MDRRPGAQIRGSWTGFSPLTVKVGVSSMVERSSTDLQVPGSIMGLVSYLGSRS